MQAADVSIVNDQRGRPGFCSQRCPQNVGALSPGLSRAAATASIEWRLPCIGGMGGRLGGFGWFLLHSKKMYNVS